ncbi:hypothetical protein [Blastopirellula retiformator]|uniref:Uncharacterized protein n=1 Tax=Blastopirellula retiformator TaxID=2527970 RepID=A0A5C5V0S0_9BACT|nr:hypothetical protein [Blastopirellula retiformator]TWT32038.1 hypothetical protein Enr8_39640 [Blastopirellula retiformator]
MSDAEEDLVPAESASPANRKPALLTALAIGGILLAVMKLGSIAATLPWLFGAQSGQTSGLGSEMQERMIEYQRLMGEVQQQYALYQLLIVPLSLITAGLLFWAALKALKLAVRGDVWMRRAVVSAAIVDLVGAAVAVFVQLAMYDAMQTAFGGMEPDPDNPTSQIMAVAMQAGFYIGVGGSIGFIALELGYYYFAYRFFAKRETRALFEQ